MTLSQTTGQGADPLAPLLRFPPSLCVSVLRSSSRLLSTTVQQALSRCFQIFADFL